MDDILFIRAKIRDYKMTYRWLCECGKKTGHMIGIESYKQICGDRHITIPKKFCSKCGKEGHVNDLTCSVCEQAIIEKAQRIFEAEYGHQ